MEGKGSRAQSWEIMARRLLSTWFGGKGTIDYSPMKSRIVQQYTL